VADEPVNSKGSMNLVYVAIAAVIAVIVVIVLMNSGLGGGGSPPKTMNVVIGGETFTLDLALHPAVRERGLGGVNEIPDHGGMLFAFSDKDVRPQSFWMKDCVTDMDIIYLDPQGRVTWAGTMRAVPLQRTDESRADYEARVRQTATRSGYPAQFVIEVKAGTVERLKVRVEDKIELDTRKLVGWAK